MAVLRPRERRLVIVAVAVVALALSYVKLVEPWLEEQREVQVRLQAAGELLARRQRLVDRRPRYLEEVEALRAELTRRRERLLPTERAPLAASELQKLVKTTAQDTGVEVRSERVLPTTERNGYTEVPVEVTLAGPIRALVSFLHRIEGAPVLLSVQDLKLRVTSVTAPREVLATLALAGYIPGATAGEPGSRPDPARRAGG